jgi:hypothetical protein
MRCPIQVGGIQPDLALNHVEFHGEPRYSSKKVRFPFQNG